MKKTGFVALALALSLLAGCSAAPGGESQTPENEGFDYAFAAAGVKKDFPLLTVDGEAVDAEEYLFWLMNSIQTWSAYGLLASDETWASNATALKEDALEVSILYQIIENKAAELGVTVDEEQIKADFDDAVAQSGGEEALQVQLDAMCISLEGYHKLNRVYYLNQAILAKLTETGEVAVTQADRDEYVNNYVTENNLYAAKHILISTRKVNEDGTGYVELSEEEKQQAYQLALNLREQLLDENDSEETFDRLMKEFSEDGRDPETGELYAPDGYTFVYPAEKVTSYDQMAMVPEFEAASLALEVGQVSDIVPTDYGYHIIMRIPLDTSSLEAYAQQNITESYKLNLLIQQWMDQAQTVTDPAYDTIDPKEFYEKLSAVNAERHPEETTPEETAPAESGN